MEIIAESMHIMNPAFLKALEEQDKAMVCRMAKEQVIAGATALDINLGRSRKLAGLTRWLIETIQEQVDVPLFLSSHVLSQPEALKAHRGTPTINAVTANPAELSGAMETAQSSGANLVVLLVSPELTPADVNGRLQLASQVMEAADQAGMPFERLYLDPVISCRADPAACYLSSGLPEINIIYESIRILKKMSDELKTIVALSNSSLYLPAGKRSSLHCQLLPLLAEAGLDAVILNCYDRNLMDRLLDDCKTPQSENLSQP